MFVVFNSCITRSGKRNSKYKFSYLFFGAARQATAKWGSTSASVPWDIDYVAVYTKVSNNKEYMLFDCLAFYFGTMIV